jgi:16S rRNA (adenine1518-N6/adenine1519-N6)-dimethyltransferase
VIAVEIDKGLCLLLTEKFSAYKNFELINADILKLDLSKFGRLKVIANLPYYISSPAIAHILNYRKSIKETYLTLQKELAMRLCSPSGTKDYGAISCLVQYYSQARILFPISNSCFWPRPKVDSCFVELKMLPKPKVKVKNEKLFFKLIRLAFNQRRKLLKNSLSSLLPQIRPAHCFEASGLKQKARAEDLSLSDFARLADYFSFKAT